MTPSHRESGKKSKLALRHLLHKFLTPKDKLKNKQNEEFVVDSEPVKDGPENTSPPENMSNEEMTNNHKNEQSESDEDSCKEEDFSGKREENTGKRERTSEKTPQTIIKNEVHGAKSVHIGTKNVTSYTIQQCYNESVTRKEKKSKQNIKLTPAIEAVLNSGKELDNCEIQFLSNHFGKSCRDIGLALELTNGQLDTIEHRCKEDPVSMAFEIMSKWKFKKGEEALVGNLCRILWNSRIKNAREAVREFSKHDFD